VPSAHTTVKNHYPIFLRPVTSKKVLLMRSRQNNNYADELHSNPGQSCHVMTTLWKWRVKIAT